jgi:hypothetical protein
MCFSQAVRTSRQNLAPHVMGPNEDELRGRDSRSLGVSCTSLGAATYPQSKTPQHSMRTSEKEVVFRELEEIGEPRLPCTSSSTVPW